MWRCNITSMHCCAYQLLRSHRTRVWPSVWSVRWARLARNLLSSFSFFAFLVCWIPLCCSAVWFISKTIKKTIFSGRTLRLLAFLLAWCCCCVYWHGDCLIQTMSLCSRHILKGLSFLFLCVSISSLLALDVVRRCRHYTEKRTHSDAAVVHAQAFFKSVVCISLT